MNKLPSGLSFAQAKKDAKKLAKKNGIPLFEAQNLIALKHSRSSWAEAVKQKEQNIHLVFNGQAITFPKEKTLTAVLGEAGTGKSIFLLDVAAQILKQGRGVLYISSFGGNSSVYLDGQYHTFLKEKYPSTFHYMYSDRLHDADSIMLGGRVLLLDEPKQLLEEEVEASFLALLRASKDTLISTQSPLDLGFLETLQQKSPDCVSNIVMFKLAPRDLDVITQNAKNELDANHFRDLNATLRPVQKKESRFIFNEHLLSLPKAQLQLVSTVAPKLSELELAKPSKEATQVGKTVTLQTASSELHAFYLHWLAQFTPKADKQLLVLRKRVFDKLSPHLPEDTFVVDGTRNQDRSSHTAIDTLAQDDVLHRLSLRSLVIVTDDDCLSKEASTLICKIFDAIKHRDMTMDASLSLEELLSPPTTNGPCHAFVLDAIDEAIALSMNGMFANPQKGYRFCVRFAPLTLEPIQGPTLKANSDFVFECHGDTWQLIGGADPAISKLTSHTFQALTQ